jgi:predicted Zn-dependent peptidase
MGNENFGIITHPNHNVHSIIFAMILPTGAVNDPNGKLGLAHLVEHLCFRRAGKLTQKEIYTKCELLGVKINGKTGKNFIQFDFRCRTDVFTEVLDIFHTMFYGINYTEEDLILEKNVIYAEIDRKEKTNFDEVMDSIWTKDCYKNEILGNRDSIDGITLQDVINYKSELFNKVGKIFLLGNFNERHLQRVQNMFVHAVDSRESNDNCEKIFRASKGFTLVKDKFEDCDVYYAFHMDVGESGDTRTRKIICAHMLNSILFEGDAAYMNEILREKEGLIYSFDSYVSVINDELIFIFNFSMNKKNLLKTLRILEDLLDMFVIKSTHLLSIKAFYCDNIELVYDDIINLCEQYLANYIDFNETVSPKQYAEIVSNLDPQYYKTVYKELTSNKNVCIWGNISGNEEQMIY